MATRSFSPPMDADTLMASLARAYPGRFFMFTNSGPKCSQVSDGTAVSADPGLDGLLGALGATFSVVTDILKIL